MSNNFVKHAKQEGENTKSPQAFNPWESAFQSGEIKLLADARRKWLERVLPGLERKGMPELERL